MKLKLLINLVGKIYKPVVFIVFMKTVKTNQLIALVLAVAPVLAVL